MTRPASDSPGLYLALQPGVKASIVATAHRLGVSMAAYVTDLHDADLARAERLTRKRRRRLEVDAETPRKRRAKR